MQCQWFGSQKPGLDYNVQRKAFLIKNSNIDFPKFLKPSKRATYTLTGTCEFECFLS